MRQMILPLLVLAFGALFLTNCESPSATEESSTIEANETLTTPAYAIVIHGGAGTIQRGQVSEQEEAEIRASLDQALSVGEEILAQGGSALDAVEQTIHILEDAPYFNAGRGAVFNHAGINEMDASFMDGATLNAGAVGGVTYIRNPISAARAVMEKSEHVLLTGHGAEQFAATQDLEVMEPRYFYTQERWDALQRRLKEDAEAEESKDKKTGYQWDGKSDDYKYGTVGCVALDLAGNIAAGTSTGGMTNKRYNRIGDSPIIGAGTYANNATCGVSCTGHGEYFIRYAVAHDVSARMQYLNESVDQAATTLIQETLKPVGGSGGLIALDAKGNISMPFNTPGMYRGYAKKGERVVKMPRRQIGDQRPVPLA
ncbi:MAG: isoaspartyl peptidase/L-asparaginase, partial [Bacteroidota bacterium]